MASKTEGTKILNRCEPCKFFHTEVREGGGWFPMTNRDRFIEALHRTASMNGRRRYE